MFLSLLKTMRYHASRNTKLKKFASVTFSFRYFLNKFLFFLYASHILHLRKLKSAKRQHNISVQPKVQLIARPLLTLSTAWLMVQDIAMGEGDLGFDFRAGQIGHSVANGLPPLRRFVGAVLLRRQAAKIGP